MPKRFIHAKNADEVITFAQQHGAKLVDFRFTDLAGIWHRITTTAREAIERFISDGIAYDASSIRGWEINAQSDLLAIVPTGTAIMDPFSEQPTLSVVCSVYDPASKEPYHRDPRGVAERAEAYLRQSGIGDVPCFALEAEFFIFDHGRSDRQNHGVAHKADDIGGGRHPVGKEPANAIHAIRRLQDYCLVPYFDAYHDLRSQMALVMEEHGLKTEGHPCKTGATAQGGINFAFDSLTRTGDNLQLYKYVVRNEARRCGKTATFMPKPLFSHPGSGMHCHQSLWKGGQNLFAGTGYAGLSDLALFYLGGLIRHSRALTAITSPTANSFKRLVPDAGAPMAFAYSTCQPSATIHIPQSDGPQRKRIEARAPDPSGCGYLSMAAQLMAGIDGIINRIPPGDPLDRHIDKLAPDQSNQIPIAPGSLKEAAEALIDDHQFLVRGDVFSHDLIDSLIAARLEEDEGMRARSRPLEFHLCEDR